MADDIQSNIKINIDTSNAMESIRLLQNQISAFHTQMAKMGAASVSDARNLQQNLINSINATGAFSANFTKIKTTAEYFTQALEKNKLTMGEYFRYAGAASKSFGKYFSAEFDTINKVARERVKDLQTQYIKLGRDTSGAMQAIKVRPLTLDLNNFSTKTQIAAQKQQLLNQLLKQGSTNLLNFGKNTQWAGRQLMVGFTIPLTIMGSAAMKAFTQMEEAAVKFKRVYGDLNTTNAETEKMVKNVQQLALEYTKYGVAVSKTMDMAAQAAATGKQGADLLAQVNNANKLAVLGGVEQSKALQTTISLTNAFGIASKDLGDNINFLNAVENQTVLNIDDMTTAIPKAAPVVRQLGGDVKDLAFFLTAMKEGGVNASEGANAIKSGLASLINPTNTASKMLAGFGINIKQIVEQDKGNLKKTVIDFAKALDSLDPLNRARAIEQLFGKFQFARMSTLFQNVIAQGSQASEVLKLTNQTSLELSMLSQKELNKIQQSPLYRYQKALADFQSQLAPVGEQFMKAITPLINFGTEALKQFNGLGDGIKQFIIKVISIGGIIGPVLIMSFGLIANAVANVIKGFALVKDIFNKTGKSSLSLGEQVSYMTQEQIQAAAVASSLDQVHSKLKQTFTSEAAAVNALTAAYERSIIAQSGFSVPITPRGPITRRATGGIIRGPGTGTSDSIPAMLSNGEAVIPASSVQKHPELVQNLIDGNISGFAKGGIVPGFANGISNLRSNSKVPRDTIEAQFPGEFKWLPKSQIGQQYSTNSSTLPNANKKMFTSSILKGFKFEDWGRIHNLDDLALIATMITQGELGGIGEHVFDKKTGKYKRVGLPAFEDLLVNGKPILTELPGYQKYSLRYGGKEVYAGIARNKIAILQSLQEWIYNDDWGKGVGDFTVNGIPAKTFFKGLPLNPHKTPRQKTKSKPYFFANGGIVTQAIANAKNIFELLGGKGASGLTPTIGFKIQDEVLGNFLRQGQYKNLFHGVASSAKDTQSQRALIEKATMGVPMGSAASKRPVYGFLTSAETVPNYYGTTYTGGTSVMARGSGTYDPLTPEQRTYEDFLRLINPQSKALQSYGGTTLFLKPEALARASISFGDTLTIWEQALKFGKKIPMVRKLLQTNKSSLAKTLKSSRSLYRQGRMGEMPYIEAHIPGGFSVQDVERIGISAGFPSQTAKKMADVQKLLNENGLSNISVFDIGSVSAEAGKKIQSTYKGYANGGIISGSGSGKSDSILARVSNGEAIIPAESVARNPQLINQLVSGNIPGFQKGRGTQFAHVSEDAVSIPAGTLLDKLIEAQNNGIKVQKNLMDHLQGVVADLGRNFRVRGYSGLGFMQDQSLNVGMRNNAPVSTESFLKDFESRGIGKWFKSIKLGGGNIKDVELLSHLEQYDNEITNSIKQHQKLNGGLEITTKQFAEIEKKARANLPSMSKLKSALDAAESGLFDIRNNLSQTVLNAAGVELSNQPSRTGVGLSSKKSGRFSTGTYVRQGGNRFTTNTAGAIGLIQLQEFIEQRVMQEINAVSQSVASGVKKSTRQASPSKDADEIGQNYGRSLNAGAKKKIKEAEVVGEKLAAATVSGATQAIPAAGNWYQRMGNKIGTSSKFQGKMIGASVVAGLGSMIPGPIGEVSGAISTPLMFASMIPGIQQVLGRLVFTFGRFIPFLGTALVAWEAWDRVAVPLMKKNADAYEAITQSLNITKEKVDSINSFFGTEGKISGIRAATPGGISSQTTKEMSIAQQFRESEQFKTNFAEPAQKLKTLSDAEVKTFVSALGADLIGMGYGEEATKAIVQAMLMEAKKTNISLDFKSFKFGEKTINNLQKNVTTILDTYKKNKDKTGLFDFEPKEKTKAAIQETVSLLSALSGQFQNGIITGKEFTANFNVVIKQFKDLEKIQPGQGLEYMLSVLKELNPETAKLAENITNIGGLSTLVEAMSLGLNVPTEAIANLGKEFNEATNKAQEKELKIAIKKAKPLKDEITQKEKLIKNNLKSTEQLQKNEQKINEKYDARIKQLDKIKRLNDQISESKKAELTLAEALNRGDIGAAARAAADVQKIDANNLLENQKQALEDAKQLELKPIKDSLDALDTTINKLESSIETLQEKIANIKITVSLPANNPPQEVQTGPTELPGAPVYRNEKTGNLMPATYPVPGSTVPTESEKQPWNKGYSLTLSRDPQKRMQFWFYNFRTNKKTEPILGKDFFSSGGYVSGPGNFAKYFAKGGYALGTDTVPAMLTPGEFVIKKSAVDRIGKSKLRDINSGASVGDSVYNNTYEINVNVRSDANPDQIARAVLTQIKQIDNHRIRGV